MIKWIFGIWTVAVALAVSVVAAYYSIIGLTAIFAAAFLPVVIMGATLEVAKITTAIWLHSFWHEAPRLMKVYLTSATLVLMLITSMGIFGFLSTAHIEQSASGSELSARLERVDDDLARQNAIIERANIAINNIGTSVSQADTDIQSRIDAQQQSIAAIRERLSVDISIQNAIIEQELIAAQPLRDELARLQSQQAQFDAAQQANDVRALQALVGATVDGVLGPDTQSRVATFQTNLTNRITELNTQIEQIQANGSDVVNQARAEIQRLQTAANEEIQRINQAIDSFRTQLVSVTTQDRSEDIARQEETIQQATAQIDQLIEQKFELEAQVRLLEVEVGPVKYIAEMVYDNPDNDALESAVRWVIILLVFVFDPLALVLILAGISIMRVEKTLPEPDEPLPPQEDTPIDDSDDDSTQPTTQQPNQDGFTGNAPEAAQSKQSANYRLNVKTI